MNNEIFQKLQDFLKRADYRPLNKSEFARELDISPKDRVDLRKALAALVENGDLEVGKKSRYFKPGGSAGTSQTIQGVIHFSSLEKRRSALFYPDAPEKVPALKHSPAKSLYVSRIGAGTAMDGDRVSVQVIKKTPKRHRYSKRDDSSSEDEIFETNVVEILERNTSSIVGVYCRWGHSACLEPQDKKLPASFHLKEVLPTAKFGDMIVAEFVSWASPDRPPTARMTKVLGRPEDPGVDMLTVIHRYHLPLKFPSEALSEAAVVDDIFPQAELAKREDWRERDVFTIDPEDARDFDDAISVRELPDASGWELAVHIADVSYYVKPGTALDKEARKRGNSVYLADRVIPMLPEKLSNGVCSLIPGADRLTHAAVIIFDKEGRQTAVRFVSAVIKSCRRYTYEEVYTRLKLSEKAAAAFEDPLERRIVAHLRRAWVLADLLRKKRFREGCFDLDFPEVRVILDEEGIAFGVKKSEHDESHQLIEEFMLAANEAVARETLNEPMPSIYRIHENPDPAKLNEFAEVARSFGYKIGDPTQRTEIQKLTKSIKGKPEEQSLKLALLKSMKRAAYSKDPIGHFGLAKSNYCHFTSPIRRYADLIVHRSLKKIMSRRKEPSAPQNPDPIPTQAGMEEISIHISKTERVAADAERDSQQIKMIEYLENLLKDDASKTFVAMVTEVRPIGIFIELKDLLVKGMIPKNDLPLGAGYSFDKAKNQFVSSIKTKKSIGLADLIEVKLVRIDKIRGFLDFTIVE